MSSSSRPIRALCESVRSPGIRWGFTVLFRWYLTFWRVSNTAQRTAEWQCHQCWWTQCKAISHCMSASCRISMPFPDEATNPLATSQQGLMQYTNTVWRSQCVELQPKERKQRKKKKKESKIESEIVWQQEQKRKKKKKITKWLMIIY